MSLMVTKARPQTSFRRERDWKTVKDDFLSSVVRACVADHSSEGRNGSERNTGLEIHNPPPPTNQELVF